MNIIDRILGEAKPPMSPEQLRQLAISQDTSTKARRAFMYAQEVIKGRWPEGEAVILRDPGTSLRYARDIIKGRWPEAEAIIATDPHCAERYVDMIVNKRVPEDIESDYVKKEIYAQKYLKNFPDRKLSWAVKGWIPFGDTTDVWGI